MDHLKTISIGFLLALFLVFGTGIGAWANQPYRIGVGDNLSIMVWNDPHLDHTLVVLPDGTITFPLIGRIKAEGYTTDALARIISNDLTVVFKNRPTVTVMIQSQGNYRFYIMGEINKPGLYHVNHRLTLLQALSMAGGFTEDADTQHLRIVHNRTHITQISMKGLRDGTDPSVNRMLSAGDLIVVPKMIVAKVYVLGQVNTPGAIPFKPGMTILEAIATAGGFNRYASMGSVRIIRQKPDGKRLKIHIDINKIEDEDRIDEREVLKPKDVIFVPQRIF